MRKVVKITFMGLVVLSISCLLCLAQEETGAKFLSIHEINRGIYTTEGFVVERLQGESPSSILSCEDCRLASQGAQCSPYPYMTCKPGVIVISEDNRIIEAARSTSRSNSMKDLFVFVPDAKKFDLGKKYKITIKLSSFEHMYQQYVTDAYANLIENEDPEIGLFSIHEINSGIYKTEGFVVSRQICPPCPQGAQCQACFPDSIVISEDNKMQGASLTSLAEDEIIVETKTPEKFEIGKKYTFTIRMYTYKPPQLYTFTELVDYELINTQ